MVSDTTFTNEEDSILNFVVIFTSTFSFLGALFIILAYWLLPKLQKFAFRLVFFMAWCDGFHALFRILDGSLAETDRKDNGSCTLLGFLTQFSSLSSILWVSVISYCIKEVVISRNQYVEDAMMYYHVFVWGSSFVISVLPFCTKSYGPAGGWCWIDDSAAGTAWRFISFYLPLWSVITYICYVYYRTLQHLANSMKTVLNRMKYYPAVLLCAYFFATINRLSQVFVNATFTLTLLHYFFTSLGGFFNSIVYGWTPTVRVELVRCMYGDGGGSGRQDRLMTDHGYESLPDDNMSPRSPIITHTAERIGDENAASNQA